MGQAEAIGSVLWAMERPGRFGSEACPGFSGCGAG
jgi:hypothetical protein